MYCRAVRPQHNGRGRRLVKAAMGRVSSPVILVGHSYGGSVITGAGTDDRVAGLVYICALAPDADETSQTQQTKFPSTDVFSHIEVVDGRIWLAQRAPSISAETFRSRSRSSFGRPRAFLAPTSSRQKPGEPLGSRSLAGTSSAEKTTPCIPIWNATLPSG